MLHFHLHPFGSVKSLACLLYAEQQSGARRFYPGGDLMDFPPHKSSNPEDSQVAQWRRATDRTSLSTQLSGVLIINNFICTMVAYFNIYLSWYVDIVEIMSSLALYFSRWFLWHVGCPSGQWPETAETPPGGRFWRRFRGLHITGAVIAVELLTERRKKTNRRRSILSTYRNSWSCLQKALSSLGVFTCRFSLRIFLRLHWNCWRRLTAAMASTGLCGSLWMDYWALRTQT